jgi:hypothetical protein
MGCLTPISFSINYGHTDKWAKNGCNISLDSSDSQSFLLSSLTKYACVGVQFGVAFGITNEISLSKNIVNVVKRKDAFSKLFKGWKGYQNTASGFKDFCNEGSNILGLYSTINEKYVAKKYINILSYGDIVISDNNKARYSAMVVSTLIGGISALAPLVEIPSYFIASCVQNKNNYANEENADKLATNYDIPEEAVTTESLASLPLEKYSCFLPKKEDSNDATSFADINFYIPQNTQEYFCQENASITCDIKSNSNTILSMLKIVNVNNDKNQSFAILSLYLNYEIKSKDTVGAQKSYFYEGIQINADAEGKLTGSLTSLLCVKLSVDDNFVPDNSILNNVVIKKKFNIESQNSEDKGVYIFELLLKLNVENNVIKIVPYVDAYYNQNINLNYVESKDDTTQEPIEYNLQGSLTDNSVLSIMSADNSVSQINVDLPFICPFNLITTTNKNGCDCVFENDGIDKEKIVSNIVNVDSLLTKDNSKGYYFKFYGATQKSCTNKINLSYGITSKNELIGSFAYNQKAGLEVSLTKKGNLYNLQADLKESDFTTGKITDSYSSISLKEVSSSDIFGKLFGVYKIAASNFNLSFWFFRILYNLEQKTFVVVEQPIESVEQYLSFKNMATITNSNKINKDITALGSCVSIGVVAGAGIATSIILKKLLSSKKSAQNLAVATPTKGIHFSSGKVINLKATKAVNICGTNNDDSFKLSNNDTQNANPKLEISSKNKVSIANLDDQEKETAKILVEANKIILSNKTVSMEVSSSDIKLKGCNGNIVSITSDKVSMTICGNSVSFDKKGTATFADVCKMKG